jgi:vacuolar iron transporter family protein
MPETTTLHNAEPHAAAASGKLNWLRAGVLGANDGIVSVAGIVIGVAAATAQRGPILTAGIAGLAAGALSMAMGEYVSVSTQRDTERALLAKERQELHDLPDEELDELTAIYERKGLAPHTARQVAIELTEHDAFLAHAEAELGIDPHGLTNPHHAALSSAIAFLTGALLPLIAVLMPPAANRIPVTMIAVSLALVLTGYISATIGNANRITAILRVTLGGLAAMAATYAIGTLVGHTLT